MLVLFPAAYGMCFGVKDAIAALDQVESPETATIWGELVHNPEVTSGLARRGFKQVNETDRASFPASEQVVITAHGISDKVLHALKAHGKKVIDTTCPLVRKAHKAVLFWAKRGYHIVVAGKRGHVEVEGLVGDIPGDPGYTVVENSDQVTTLPFARIAVVSQTTTPPDVFGVISKKVKEIHLSSEVVVVDTVCQPTRDRQAALQSLLPKVDVLVVVGGKGSNNTKRLCEQGTRAGKPWVWVEREDELDERFFEGVQRVALAAGTSTPDSTIQAVHRRLLSISRRLSRSVVAGIAC
jgi:4-hydroxy-3-methylbut-2-en-1-yl diphosphate reductase